MRADARQNLKILLYCYFQFKDNNLALLVLFFYNMTLKGTTWIFTRRYGLHIKSVLTEKSGPEVSPKTV